MPDEPYDSRAETLAHIHRVQELLAEVIDAVGVRGAVHDESKLCEPEKSAFDRCTPMLRATEYGSPEYEAAKAELDRTGALQHHYAKNSHHAEHWPHGVTDMTLLDLIEMLADWKAAGERHADGGDLRRSIENDKRLDDAQRRLLMRTAEELGWL